MVDDPLTDILQHLLLNSNHLKAIDSLQNRPVHAIDFISTSNAHDPIYLKLHQPNRKNQLNWPSHRSMQNNNNFVDKSIQHPQ